MRSGPPGGRPVGHGSNRHELTAGEALAPRMACPARTSLESCYSRAWVISRSPVLGRPARDDRPALGGADQIGGILKTGESGWGAPRARMSGQIRALHRARGDRARQRGKQGAVRRVATSSETARRTGVTTRMRDASPGLLLVVAVGRRHHLLADLVRLGLRAFIIDVFSRRVVGWARSQRCAPTPPSTPWRWATDRPRVGPGVGGLIPPLLRGRLEPRGALHPAAGRGRRGGLGRLTGDSYENALAEAFTSLYKA